MNQPTIQPPTNPRGLPRRRPSPVQQCQPPPGKQAGWTWAAPSHTAGGREQQSRRQGKAGWVSGRSRGHSAGEPPEQLESVAAAAVPPPPHMQGHDAHSAAPLRPPLLAPPACLPLLSSSPQCAPAAAAEAAATTHQPVEARVGDVHARVVGVDGAKGEVFCRDGQLGEGVEQGRLAHVGQAHDAHLQLG